MGNIDKVSALELKIKKMFFGIFGQPSNGNLKQEGTGSAMPGEGKVVHGGLPGEMKMRLIEDGSVAGGKENQPHVLLNVESLRKRLSEWSVEYEAASDGASVVKWIWGNDKDKKQFDLMVDASKLADEMMRFPARGLDNDDFVGMLAEYLRLEVNDPRRRFAVRYLMGGIGQLIKVMDSETDEARLKKMKDAMGMLFLTAGMAGLGDDKQREQLMKLLLSTPAVSGVAFSYFNGLFADPSNQSPEMLEKRGAFIDYVVLRKLTVPSKVDENVLATFIDLMPFPGLRSSDAFVIKALVALNLYIHLEPRPSDEKIEEYFRKFKLGFRGLDPNSKDGRIIVDILQMYEGGLSDAHKRLFAKQTYPFALEIK